MSNWEIPKKETLIKLYSKGYSMEEIGKELKMATGKIFRYFHKYSIETRPGGSQSDVAKKKISKAMTGRTHKPHIWTAEEKRKMSEKQKIKGIGHKKDRRDGYIYVYYPSHPKSSKDGYIMEHRLIMEKIIGRYLEDKEVVHHKNRIRNDNRIENLQLMTTNEHARLHCIERNKKKEMMTY